jgi:dihydrofolate reductase
LGGPYGNTPTVVITNRELPSVKNSVEFYSGDLKRLVDEIPAPPGNIWLVGGRRCGRVFSELGLVDEIRLSIVRPYWVTGYSCLTTPVLKGDGISRT